MKQILYRSVILMVCLVLLCGCKRPPPDLVSIVGQIESITVYNLEGLSGPKFSKQDLNNAFHATLDPKLFQELAPEAKFKDEWVMWKGSRLAVVKMNDGAEKEMALSYYGGFFKILGEDGYFYFEGESRDKWEKAFLKAIVQEDFIPRRIERNKRQEEEKP